jgi:hypothetical protein
VSGLISAETVGEYLAGRGSSSPRSRAGEELGGGVSNVVLAVEADGFRAVVSRRCHACASRTNGWQSENAR